MKDEALIKSSLILATKMWALKKNGILTIRWNDTEKTFRRIG